MTDAQLVDCLSFGVSMVGILVLLRLGSSHSVDVLREGLFTLRDELFIYACDEKLMEDPAYRELRQLMNGMIRYAHRLSLIRILMLMLTYKIFGIKPVAPETLKRWNAATQALPDRQATKLIEFHRKAIAVMVMHISPLGLAPAAAVIGRLRSPQRKISGFPSGDIIEMEAMRGMAA